MSQLDTGGLPTPTIRWRFPSVHPDGRKFVVIGIALTLLFGYFIGHWLAWPMGGVTLWIAAFFRDPIRTVPQGDDLIVAPADGLVCLIRSVTPPREMGGSGALGDAPLTRVSIFMSVFDVHINRTPITGTIRSVIYIAGKFVNADLDKASEDNERQHIVVERGDGMRVGFTQIAGLIARRIVPFVKGGDTVVAGQRVGLIRFGSRVDVYLPAGYVPRVALGQRTMAGETVLASSSAARATVGISQ